MPTIGHGTEICTSTTRPSTAAEGLMIYETDTNKVLVNSSATSTPSWVEVNDLDSSYGLNAGFYSSIKNVVMGTDSTQNIITSTSLTDTGLSVNITPSSSNNKILVFATVPCQTFRTDNAASGGIALVRNSTVIWNTIGTSHRIVAGMVSGFVAMASTVDVMYLDSPATTSTINYKIQARVQIAGEMATQYNNETSSIIAMEVVV